MPTTYTKYHALGNDYLVLDPKDSPGVPLKDAIVRICHRNFGLGSDGILYGPVPSERAPFGLRILNPDGSEAEKSGNGLRIFCRYLFDCGLVEDKPFAIDTPGGVVQCAVRDNAREIAVEMGRVSFRSDVIPVAVDGAAREVVDEPFAVAGESLRLTAATVGNPHAVFPVDKATRDMACRIGPAVENHPMFPNRTNMQLLEVVDRSTIRIEIWERGAGYTLASGSSSSAAAAVAHRLGLVDRDITVLMPGGQLSIQIDSDYGITMTGPATRVGTMELDDEVFTFSI